MATKQSLSAPPPKPKARQRFTDVNRSSKKKVADTSKPLPKRPSANVAGRNAATDSGR